MTSMDRKDFLTRSFQLAAGAFLAGPLFAELGVGHSVNEDVPWRQPGDPDPIVFSQMPLPYAFDALEPYLDRMTMEIHYTKHHAAYVKNINESITEEGITATTPEALFAGISKYSAKARNNSGGAWNHNLYWQLMKPGGGGDPTGKVLDAINGAFGSVEAFKKLFTDAGMKRFGSGWSWLVADNGRLSIGSTPNQDNPLMDVSELRGTPLLGMDVWEHAYYLKYQNKRDEYIANWWSVVNWDEVARRMA
jgi:Fe-Mn family superoxide dismutase